MSANDIQIAGSHYKDKAIQPWDYIVGNDLGYLEGNIVKYISRWRDKNGVDDLRKAQHYLKKLLEVANASHGGNTDEDAGNPQTVGGVLESITLDDLRAGLEKQRADSIRADKHDIRCW